MPTILIRDAHLTDVTSVQDVFRRASLSNEGDRASLLANPDALAFSDLPVTQGRTRVAVSQDGTVVGYVTTEVVGPIIEIEDLFVDPDWMRQGIGRALVSDAERVALRHAADRFEVTANRHALTFYEKVGFVVDSVVETRFGSGLRMHRDVSPTPAAEQ